MKLNSMGEEVVDTDATAAQGTIPAEKLNEITANTRRNEELQINLTDLNEKINAMHTEFYNELMNTKTIFLAEKLLTVEEKLDKKVSTAMEATQMFATKSNTEQMEVDFYAALNSLKTNFIENKFQDFQARMERSINVHFDKVNEQVRFEFHVRK